MNYADADVIVVGGGQAGLSASYYLKAAGVRHIVFERGRIGESWRSQRWNSFKMNSSNQFNLLPGAQLNGRTPEAFCTNKEFITSLEEYAALFQLPVMEYTNVISIEKPSRLFKVTIAQNNAVSEYYSRQIIIASGIQNEKKIPRFAANITSAVKQLHTSEYRHPAQLPDGAVLVVGSGQSGVQIAEDLIAAEKKVYLSSSMAGRVPRRYRGRDIIEWLVELGFFNLKTEDVTDPAELTMKPPQLTGTGGQAQTISLQHLAKKGVVIVGRMHDAANNDVFFQPDAKQHIQFADAVSGKVKHMIDAFIQRNGLPAPLPEEDMADVPDPDGACASSFITLDLKAHNITSVIWATGFCGNFNYIKVPVLNSNGNPEHQKGISAVKGLYFLGLPWLRKRQSSIIHGMKEDAAFICKKICEYALEQQHIV